jgi:uncharacterized protein YqhQ
MSKEKLRLPSYGGQALIEGVLMRGSKYLAVAMRDPAGKIQVQTEKLQGLYSSFLARTPFLRGLVIFWDAIGLGTKYLTISANLQTGEDEKIEGKALAGTLVVSFGLAVGLFFLAPAGIAALIQKWLPISPFVTNLFEGFIRLLLVIVYIWGVGKMPDIKRVFSYHGAEHKTINAFEAGAELTPENVKNFSLHHPRCGTGFVLILVIFSVILFTIIGPLDNLALRLLSRVILLPVLVMFAYEYIRFVAKHLSNPFIKLFSLPGMAMQNLTTNEPSIEMLEVSIASFNAMIALEKATESEV